MLAHLPWITLNSKQFYTPTTPNVLTNTLAMAIMKQHYCNQIQSLLQILKAYELLSCHFHDKQDPSIL